MMVLASRRLKYALWFVILAQGALAVWISRPWLTADSIQYLRLAESLALNGAYGSMTADGFSADVLRPPAYPIILWVLHHVLALPLWAISLLQVAALSLSMYLAQRILEHFEIEPVPMLALAAIYPFPAMYSANIMTEAWAVLAITGIAALLVLSKKKLKTYLFVGALSGFAILLRADMLLLPPFLAAIIWLVEKPVSGSNREKTFWAGSVVLGALVILLPYMLWNLANFGNAKPVPLAGALGNSLYIATWQPILPFEDISALDHGVITPRAEASGLGTEVRAMNRAIGAPELTAPWNPAAYPTRSGQVEITEHTRRLALRRIADNPESYAGHVIANTWRLWNTANYPSGVPLTIVNLLRLISAIVFICGLAGVFLTLVKTFHWRLPPILAGVFVYVPGVHVFLHTEARYTAPARVLLLIFAGAFIWHQIERFVSRKGE